MMMSKNLKNVDIRLDPPELGRLQIRLNVGGDGATVHFTVANQQARDVIEQSMPRLREMLAQQGVQLGDSSVQQQSSGSRIAMLEITRVMAKVTAIRPFLMKKTLNQASILI